MIRPATTEDIPVLATMGKAFIGQNGASDITGLDDGSILATLRGLIDGENGCLLVMERDGQVVGMAGAIVYPWYFNANHWTGQELFWWVEPAARGGPESVKLLTGLEAWAKGRGAQSFGMLRLEAMGEGLDAFYRRRGYRPVEHSYLRRL